jgi:hypothetical protein
VLALLAGVTVKLMNRTETQPVPVAVANTKDAWPDSGNSQAATSPKITDDNKSQSPGTKNAPDVKTAKNESKKPSKTGVPEKKVQGVKQSARVRTLVETTGAPALVSLVITPWGEITLDGRIQGASPPLLELQVVEGKHVIKISNSTFPSVTKTITVKAGEKIKIKHKFAD